MGMFYVNAETTLLDDEFLIEADDFVSATMKALDFLRELDSRVAKHLGEPVVDSKIITLNEIKAIWANEEGIQKCLERLEAHQEDD